ncbi:hypothetical protein RCH18_001103 [Flavobacterium sp. PL11]|jgi:hypothetical protein|nr:hypothetical protein [Flavobacterium sp. PL11]
MVINTLILNNIIITIVITSPIEQQTITDKIIYIIK